MIYSLGMQTTYNEFELGVFHQEKLISSLKKDRQLTSKYITIFIDEILKAACISFQDISYIAATTGPAPVTSLRVMLATINGLAFVSGIPLINIDGLKNFLDEYSQNNQSVVALFNAFGQEVFFGYFDDQQQFHTGCQPSIVLFEQLEKIKKDKKIIFIGQGVEVVKQEIHNYFDAQAIMPDPLPTYLSFEMLGKVAFTQWQKKLTHQQLLPLYMKRRQYSSLI